MIMPPFRVSPDAPDRHGLRKITLRRGQLRKMSSHGSGLILGHYRSHRPVDYLRENRRGNFSNSRLTATPRHSSSEALRSKLGQV